MRILFGTILRPRRNPPPELSTKKEIKKKENPPHTPLKEKETEKETFPEPVPEHHARAGERARTREGAFRPGSGAVDIRQNSSGSGSGSGTGTGTGKRVKVDHDFIMNPAYDPVQIALLVLGIPKLTPGHNNARLMRWAIRIIGEDAFRELVYRQWRENSLDGTANNAAAAFQRKLNNAVSAAKGGAR